LGKAPNRTAIWPDDCPRRVNFELEVAAGLEPAKTGFADQRLDHFGIATKTVRK
jgi:hypothetical protein